MRKRVLIVLPVLVAALFLAGGATRAQVGPIAVPPGTILPGGAVQATAPFISAIPYNGALGPPAFNRLPYNFDMTVRIGGGGFHPGEQVTISVSGVSTAPVITSADESGSFIVDMPLTWQFCGPNAQAGPTLTFTATGDVGSAANTVLSPPRCPALYASIHYSGPPEGGPPAGGSGGVVVVGTAVAVPGGPIGGSVPAPAPSPIEKPVQPEPISTQAPVLQQIDVEGFGFVPDEHVLVAQTGSGSQPPVAGTQVTADTLGRFQVGIKAWLPPLCGEGFEPVITAVGDRGTAVGTPIFWIRPLVACPLIGGPSEGAPPGGSNAVPPAPASQSDAPSAGLLGLHVHPATLRDGHGARATITSATAVTAQLTVRYPGGTATHRSIPVQAGGSATVRWRVPTHAAHGQAQIELVAGTERLQAAVPVR
jgi:hypothetical protein